MASAIIVFNGCFCPVHAGHVKALEDTKKKIEAGGKVRVVAGYFAVAPDHYVRRKLGGKLEPWMAVAERVDLCKAVAKDSSWAISAGEFEGWKRCGTEMVAKRHDSSTQVVSVRAEAKKGGVVTKGVGVTASLSSTGIRAELARRGYTDDAVDGLVDRGFLGRAVGDCLKHKLFASKSGGVGARDEALPTEAAPVLAREPARSVRGKYGKGASGLSDKKPECFAALAREAELATQRAATESEFERKRSDLQAMELLPRPMPGLGRDLAELRQLEPTMPGEDFEAAAALANVRALPAGGGETAVSQAAAEEFLRAEGASETGDAPVGRHGSAQ